MDIFCFNSYSEGREVSIIRIPRHCLYAPLVWKFLKKLFYSLWYCWLGLAPEFVLKLLAAPRFSTSCIFWKYEVKKKKTFILHLPHSISECQSGNEASTKLTVIKATTKWSMLFWIRHWPAKSAVHIFSVETLHWCCSFGSNILSAIHHNRKVSLWHWHPHRSARKYCSSRWWPDWVKNPTSQSHNFSCLDTDTGIHCWHQLPNEKPPLHEQLRTLFHHLGRSRIVLQDHAHHPASTIRLSQLLRLVVSRPPSTICGDGAGSRFT